MQHAQTSQVALRRQALVSSDQAGRRLRELLALREAGSVIRLGDGEGMVLAAADLGRRLHRDYFESHFGPHIDQGLMEILRERLHEAIRGAAIIGLRDDLMDGEVDLAWFDYRPRRFLRTFLAHFRLRPEERTTLGYPEAYRLARLNTVYGQPGLFEHAMLTSAWCHFDWSASSLLAELIRGSERVGLVSGHAALAHRLREFGTEVDFYPVPLRYHRREPGWAPHYPDRFEELLDTLEVAYPGQLFLVGAGICGKVYCHEIARRGGVAVDVGAVCDAWLGLASRPLVMRSRWGTERVPDELLLGRQLNISPGDA
jgi:hypothetical protein